MATESLERLWGLHCRWLLVGLCINNLGLLENVKIFLVLSLTVLRQDVFWSHWRLRIFSFGAANCILLVLHLLIRDVRRYFRLGLFHLLLGLLLGRLLDFRLLRHNIDLVVFVLDLHHGLVGLLLALGGLRGRMRGQDLLVGIRLSPWRLREMALLHVQVVVPSSLEPELLFGVGATRIGVLAVVLDDLHLLVLLTLHCLAGLLELLHHLWGHHVLLPGLAGEPSLLVPRVDGLRERFGPHLVR